MLKLDIRMSGRNIPRVDQLVMQPKVGILMLPLILIRLSK